MSGFALASTYSMPSASHGDVDLSDSSARARTRALNQFLSGIELKAFKIAQAGLRNEDDALDAVQDAMLQLARAYADRPAEEWKPLFYRILENRIRDMQRRRTVRGRVMAWLPFKGEDEDDDLDPIAQAPSQDPSNALAVDVDDAKKDL
jgi:RNA polymerase sigma-70 factor (ECF subfamily)